jgi:hypothetical protein
MVYVAFVTDVAYQPLDRAPSHGDPLPVELAPHLPRAIHLVVLLPHPFDLHEEPGIT